MASSANGTSKVRDCIGNHTGNLPSKAWSVITYNAGLHDCDTTQYVNASDYAANLKAVFETLKPAASAVVFVLTTPFDMYPDYVNHTAGIHMKCVLEYNEIAKNVAHEAGAIILDDIYAYVESFCGSWPKYSNNYTNCARSIQTRKTGLHFFTKSPLPSGQQFTALSVAETILRLVPESQISNASGVDEEPPSLTEGQPLACGDPPAPLSKTLPNVLVIGDSISMPGSGYTPGVKGILEKPYNPLVPPLAAPPNSGSGQPIQMNSTSGALASVQHSGGTGSNQAGPSTNGAACAKTWIGTEKWDVITMNFGIHDCCAGGDGRPAGVQIDQADYMRNIASIYEAARAGLAPNGKVVWVSTTPHGTGADQPAVERNDHNCNQHGNFSSCITEYNTAAAAFFHTKSDVAIADLHGAVTDVCGGKYYNCNLQLWNNVHSTQA